MQQPQNFAATAKLPNDAPKPWSAFCVYIIDVLVGKLVRPKPGPGCKSQRSDR